MIKKSRFPNVVIPIIVINVIVFFIQMVAGETFNRMFALVPSEILSRPWIIITSMFMHGGPDHLLVNMFMLFMFGTFLERILGPKRVLTLYFISGIIAAIGHSIFSINPAWGASGALMGIMGTIIVLMPKQKVLFFFVIPMPLWFLGILYVAIDVFGVFNPSGVGNIAHLSGMFIGLSYGFFLRSKKKKHTRRFLKKKSKHMNDNDIEDYIKNGRL